VDNDELYLTENVSAVDPPLDELRVCGGQVDMMIQQRGGMLGFCVHA
jgi:hypothetical protein